MAKALGVKNVGKYRKNELIEMLSGKSETPAPKKRGRPTKAAAAQKPAAPAAQKAEPAEEKPAQQAAKPAPKGKDDRQRKQPPEKAKAPAAEKPQEPAQEAPKAEGKEEAGEKDHRRNERAQSNRYQKGVNRHYSSFTNGERRYANQNVQDQRANRPAAPANSPANGEEEKPYYNQEYGTANPAVPKMLETENCPPTEGVLEVLPDGYGFLRMNNYYSGPKDIYLSITQIRRFSLKTGDYVEGRARPHREGDKFDALMYIDKVNGLLPDENARRKTFEELVPIFPNERYTLETAGESNSLSARLIDLIAPIGKGQRAMIVSQPKAGKTTLLKQIAAGISANYPDTHLMVLLIDERPEEVTEMKRCIRGEVVYSTFDELPEHHTRIAEMVQERAMRLVEQGRDVVILLDSLTRLTRAYNLVIPPTGRTLSGGPRRPPQAQAVLWRGPEHRGWREPHRHRHGPGGDRQPHGRHRLRGVQGHRQHGDPSRSEAGRKAGLPGHRHLQVRHPAGGAAALQDGAGGRVHAPQVPGGGRHHGGHGAGGAHDGQDRHQRGVPHQAQGLDQDLRAPGLHPQQPLIRGKKRQKIS